MFVDPWELSAGCASSAMELRTPMPLYVRILQTSRFGWTFHDGVRAHMNSQWIHTFHMNPWGLFSGTRHSPWATDAFLHVLPFPEFSVQSWWSEASFRRAKALFEMGELEQAIVDATKVVSWHNMFQTCFGWRFLESFFLFVGLWLHTFQRSGSNIFEGGASCTMSGDEGVIQVSCTFLLRKGISFGAEVDHYARNTQVSNPEAVALRQAIQQQLKKERAKWGEKSGPRWNRAAADATPLVSEVGPEYAAWSSIDSAWSGLQIVPCVSFTVQGRNISKYEICMFSVERWHVTTNCLYSLWHWDADRLRKEGTGKKK